MELPFNGGDSKQDKKVNIYKINKIYTRWGHLLNRRIKQGEVCGRVGERKRMFPFKQAGQVPLQFI